MQIEPHVGMVWIPGGAFRMRSDQHYPEERPAHRVKPEASGLTREPSPSRISRASSTVVTKESDPYVHRTSSRPEILAVAAAGGVTVLTRALPVRRKKAE